MSSLCRPSFSRDSRSCQDGPLIADQSACRYHAHIFTIILSSQHHAGRSVTVKVASELHAHLVEILNLLSNQSRHLLHSHLAKTWAADRYPRNPHGLCLADNAVPQPPLRSASFLGNCSRCTKSLAEPLVSTTPFLRGFCFCQPPKFSD